LNGESLGSYQSRIFGVINADRRYKLFSFVIDIVPTVHPKLILSDPGEIKRDFESEFARLQQDIEKKKNEENKLSEDLIKQIEVIFVYSFSEQFMYIISSHSNIQYFQEEETRIRLEEEEKIKRDEEIARELALQLNARYSVLGTKFRHCLLLSMCSL